MPPAIPVVRNFSGKLADMIPWMQAAEEAMELLGGDLKIPGPAAQEGDEANLAAAALAELADDSGDSGRGRR